MHKQEYEEDEDDLYETTTKLDEHSDLVSNDTDDENNINEINNHSNELQTISCIDDENYYEDSERGSPTSQAETYIPSEQQTMVIHQDLLKDGQLINTIIPMQPSNVDQTDCYIKDTKPNISIDAQRQICENGEEVLNQGQPQFADCQICDINYHENKTFQVIENKEEVLSNTVPTGLLPQVSDGNKTTQQDVKNKEDTFIPTQQQNLEQEETIFPQQEVDWTNASNIVSSNNDATENKNPSPSLKDGVDHLLEQVLKSKVIPFGNDNDFAQTYKTDKHQHITDPTVFNLFSTASEGTLPHSGKIVKSEPTTAQLSSQNDRIKKEMNSAKNLRCGRDKQNKKHRSRIKKKIPPEKKLLPLDKLHQTNHKDVSKPLQIATGETSSAPCFPNYSTNPRPCLTPIISFIVNSLKQIPKKIILPVSD